MDSVCAVYAAAPQQNSTDFSISAVTWMEDLEWAIERIGYKWVKGEVGETQGFN